ncbi:DNA-binding response regulator [Rhodococcoides trifolii]|uniref:DNA-binding response regulator n=1 Tax=Rhodococcoides trifolii TaxID=908250 RepID=A0A917G3Q7_9NOCA|nr:response regulator transcription factor [Rhodococcus trifolii]GGG20922.1 DNA-binding response regulator [Rhodococcus trifolii]
MTDAIRIALIDDERLIRESLRALLSLQPDITVIAEYDSGAALLDALPTLDADVLLLDIAMPGMDGLSTAAALRTAGSQRPIVMLTSQGKPGYLRRALDAGAQGFATKDTPGTTLASVIRTVHGGGRYVDPQIAEDAMFAGESPLTDRERQILELFRSGATTAAVARTLGIGEGTVRNYTSSAMTKLGVNGKNTAWTVASELGWI